MAEVEIYKLGLDTQEAVKNVQDLKDNIKFLKDNLNTLDIGTEEYKKNLELLNVNQNALKDAMYATSGDMKDVAKSAQGASLSYNSLVHAMADLKREFRATTDAQRQIDLADQINNINNELKRLDALQGNFQRNVGNYQSAFQGLSENIDTFGKGLKFSNMGLGDMKDSMGALAKSPMIATFGILVSVMMNLADKVKENEGVMNSLKKVMNAMKPVFDLFSGVIEKVATTIADIIEKVVPFITSNGIINKVINGVVGIGNAILQFVIAPFKGVIEAIKVFKEQGIKGLGDASRAFANEMKNGISFKQNFEAGQGIVDAIIAGVKDKAPEAKKEAKKAGEDIGKKLAEGIMKDFEKALAKVNKEFDEDLKNRLDNQKFADDLMLEEEARFNAEMEKYWEEQERLENEKIEKEKERAKARIDTMYSVANATSGILSTIADMYENDEKDSEKNANKVKALRIASAMINTISGAIGAFTQASETIPPPYGQIVGATSASLVTATGLAQIAKLKATKISGSASNPSPSVPAVTTAPAMSMDIPKVRSVTSASEEDRLNYMARDQKVALVMSELELKQNQVKVQVTESSF